MTLSILGATIFWFFSALGKDYNYRIKYPIQLVFDRDSLIMIKSPSKYLDLEVSGGGWDLFRQNFWFGSDPILFYMDAPTEKTFFTREDISSIISEQLEEFEINIIHNDTISFDIDRRSSKKVALKLDSMSINMEDDYRITSAISISPDSTLISGPESFIDTLKDTWIFSLGYQEIDNSFDRFVPLGLPDKYEINADPSSTNVTFEVDRFLRIEKTIPIELLNFPDDSSAFLEPTTVQLSFTIQRALEEELEMEDFKVVVDYNMMELKDSLAPAVVVFYPEIVSEISMVPDSLKIFHAQ